MSAVDHLYEQLTDRQLKRTSDERWGRGPTDEEKAQRAAAILTRKCGKCGARKTGSFDVTADWWAGHMRAGCR